MKSERERLTASWLRVTGHAMPPEIASQPIEVIRRAVILATNGDTVVVPREKRQEAKPEPDSMIYWDSNSND